MDDQAGFSQRNAADEAGGVFFQCGRMRMKVDVDEYGLQNLLACRTVVTNRSRGNKNRRP